MRFPFRNKPPVTSARQHCDDWLQWLELSGYSPRTIEGYARQIAHFLSRWSDLALADFTEEHIIGYIEEASIRSRQHRRSCFHTLFTWAARVRRIEKNPMAHVPHYKQPQQHPVNTFTEAEVKTLTALPEPNGTLLAVLFGAGLRKAEARHLTPRKIDFENAELHIVDGAKGGSVGVVPLSAGLVHRLAAYIETEELGLDDFLWGSNPGGSHKRRHDRPLSDGGMQKWWTRAMEASGLEYRNLHATRHTFATLLRRRGLAVDDVSDLLRHADPRTTRRVYIHLNAVDIRRRMEAQGVEAVA